MSNFKDTYSRIKNSDEFKRQMYIRRLTGVFVIFFYLIFGFLAGLAENIFSVSGYVTYGVAGFIAITASVFTAEKFADKKFGRKK